MAGNNMNMNDLINEQAIHDDERNQNELRNENIHPIVGLAVLLKNEGESDADYIARVDNDNLLARTNAWFASQTQFNNNNPNNTRPTNPYNVLTIINDWRAGLGFPELALSENRRRLVRVVPPPPPPPPHFYGGKKRKSRRKRKTSKKRKTRRRRKY
jgi:hypothetical protein